MDAAADRVRERGVRTTLREACADRTSAMAYIGSCIVDSGQWPLRQIRLPLLWQLRHPVSCASPTKW